MKDYTKRNAYYRRIPCFYNPITDELKGINRFYDWILSITLWFDVNVVQMEEFPIWIEEDELEK